MEEVIEQQQPNLRGRSRGTARNHWEKTLLDPPPSLYPISFYCFILWHFSQLKLGRHLLKGVIDKLWPCRRHCERNRLWFLKCFSTYSNFTTPAGTQGPLGCTRWTNSAFMHSRCTSKLLIVTVALNYSQTHLFGPPKEFSCNPFDLRCWHHTNCGQHYEDIQGRNSYA